MSQKIKTYRESFFDSYTFHKLSDDDKEIIAGIIQAAARGDMSKLSDLSVADYYRYLDRKTKFDLQSVFSLRRGVEVVIRGLFDERNLGLD